MLAVGTLEMRVLLMLPFLVEPRTEVLDFILLR